MLIGMRNAMLAGKRLPYDAEVEYLESTGTQWIDTGIAPTDQTAATLTGQFSRLQGRTRFGCRDVAYSRQFCIISTATNGIRFDLGSGGADTSQWEVASDATKLELNARTNSARLTPPTGAAFTHTFSSNTKKFSNHSILLFAFYNGTGVSIAQSMVVRSLKISDGGALVRDMIPVRFTNEQGQSEGAMYDRVSGQLFGNQGTGAFVIGPDKSVANGGGGISANA